MTFYPLIGLPTLAIPPGEKPARFGINQTYVRALEAAGCAPVLIPLLEDEDQLRSIYERLDGIVFPGGADVAPGEYGEQPIENLNVIHPERDRVELTLARWALEADLPTLGICRGQQVLNVALGGTLYQDLAHQGVTNVDHSDEDGRARSALIHRVRLDAASRLAQLIDETSIEVNSLHHQAIKQLAPGLNVTGRTDDGIIEAVESADRRFLIAVQWHPEELHELPWARRLFAGFVKEVAGLRLRRGERRP
ncbi:MAG TPA: gamma-glutamyl-gamma-aminobutyrate hydrolase family protein [Candidatus Dormibacteraeota bacterium]